MVHRTASKVIREARHRSGLSQAELARRSGVSQPVISVYENGHRDPSLSMLQKLVHAAGSELVIELASAPVNTRGLPDTPVGRRLRRTRRAINEAAARRGATNVRVFGSVARGTDTESSDVDLLVDLPEGVGLLGLIGLEREIANLLGRAVDVVPAAELKAGIREKALDDAIPL
jgi:predicted nucleotidyltransferase/DNA-binding XRE family transcriptional regulator